MSSLQKNVASQKVTFCLVSASTGAALTSATFTSLAWVTVDGTQAGFAGTFTTLGNGQFQYAPTQGETNGTDIGILITPSGAVPVNLDFHTDVVDGNGLLQVDLVDIAGSAVATGSAQLGVNVVNIGTHAVSLDANNLLKVDVNDWFGSVVATPATAGFPDINVRNISNSPVSTTVGQIGVNLIGIQGNVANVDGNGNLEVCVTDWDGTAVGALPANFSALSISSGGLVSVTSNVKKDVALSGFTFLMTNATTNAPDTGLTVTAQRSINGGALGSCSNSVSEIANGLYQINLSASDLNGNVIVLRFTASGANDKDILIITQP